MSPNRHTPAHASAPRLLYVGGRAKCLAQLQAITDAHGYELLYHDGGIEDRAGAHLIRQIESADVVMFPVNGICHSSAGVVKRVCKKSGKPFFALRTAGLSGFSLALTALTQAH